MQLNVVAFTCILHLQTTAGVPSRFLWSLPPSVFFASILLHCLLTITLHIQFHTCPIWFSSSNEYKPFLMFIFGSKYIEWFFEEEKLRIHLPSDDRLNTIVLSSVVIFVVVVDVFERECVRVFSDDIGNAQKHPFVHTLWERTTQMRI